MAKRIAIAGATGAVGTLVRQILEQRDFPYASIKFLASKRSVGKTLTFKGEQHTVELLEPKAFDDVDIVIGSTCLLYTSPSPRDRTRSRMPSSA